MANESSEISIKLSLKDLVTQGLNKIKAGVSTTDEKVKGLNDTLKLTSDMSRLMIAGIGTSIGLTINAIANLSDKYSLLSANIKGANISGEDFDRLNSKLIAKANEVRVSYSGLATTYSDLAKSCSNLFKNNDELVGFTSNMMKLTKMNDMDENTSSSYITMLTKSLTNGELSSQMYSQMKVNIPQMVEILQDYYKVNSTELDKMVSDGKVSSIALKNAMLQATGDINREFEDLPITFGDALTLMKNNFTAEIQPVLKVASVGAKILADNMHIIVPILSVIAVQLGIITTKMIVIKALSMSAVLQNLVGALTAVIPMLMGSSAAASAFAFSINGLTTAIAANPIGLIAVGITLAIVALTKLIQKFGGVKATWLILQDALISGFQIVCEKIGTVLDVLLAPLALLINGIKLAKSLITGEEFNAFSFSKVKYDEEAHQQRQAEIEKAKSEHNAENGVNEVYLKGLSSEAEGSITKSVKLADEDVKMIQDISERSYINKINLATMAPSISVRQTVNGGNGSDVNAIVDKIGQVLSEQRGTSSNFVYG